MRKLSLIVLIVALSISFMPRAIGQDDTPPTIYAVLQERATSETPEFTILLAAIDAADPIILDRLNDPEVTAATFTTLLAPTDSAFTTLLGALGMTPADVLASPDLVTSVLQNHLMAGIFTTENFATNPDALWGTFVPTSYVKFSVDEDNVVWVNESAAVVEENIEALNGAIHAIDSVLVPSATPVVADSAEDSIYDILSSREDFSLFKTIIDTLGFQLDLNLTPYTLFIPTDDVLQALLDSFGITLDEFLANSDTSTPILFYHFLSGSFDSASFTAWQPEEGEEGAEGVVFASQQVDSFLTVTVGEDDALVVDGTVNIVEPDIYASNGVIHVIDSILLPQ